MQSCGHYQVWRVWTVVMVKFFVGICETLIFSFIVEGEL